jgi:hypothetical protein
MNSHAQKAFNHQFGKNDNRENTQSTPIQLLDPRERNYYQTKQLHNEMTIDIPDLFPKEELKPPSSINNQGSPNDLSQNKTLSSFRDHTTTSQMDSNQGFKLHQSKSPQNHPRQNGTRYVTDPQTFTPKINDNAKGIERRVEDLYRWQDRINKKHQVQREFFEHVKNSEHTVKVFTNDSSNALLENRRPNAKVEDLLMQQVIIRNEKLRQKERDIYSNLGRPNITNKGKNLDRPTNVYSRLYDLDKSRRDKSREERSFVEHKRSVSIGKIRATSPPAHLNPVGRKNTTKSEKPLMIQTDFNFHPVSSMQNLARHTYDNGRSYLTPSAASSSSKRFASPRSPDQRPNGAPANQLNITGNTETKTSEKFAPCQEKSNEQKKPVNIYKSLLQVCRDNQTQGKTATPSQTYANNRSTSKDSIHKDISPISPGKKRATAKNNERPDETVAMQSMEAYWDQILQDDIEQQNSKYSRDQGRQGIDINERNKIWAETKNKKLDEKKKVIKDQELKECTFKPFFYTKLKEEFQKQHEVMYQNFLDRVSHKVSPQGKSPTSSQNNLDRQINFTTATSPLRSSQGFEGGFKANSNMQNSSKNFGSPQNPRYLNDVGMQSRLINYILDTGK